MNILKRIKIVGISDFKECGVFLMISSPPEHNYICFCKYIIDSEERYGILLEINNKVNIIMNRSLYWKTIECVNNKLFDDDTRGNILFKIIRSRIYDVICDYNSYIKYGNNT